MSAITRGYKSRAQIAFDYLVKRLDKYADYDALVNAVVVKHIISSFKKEPIIFSERVIELYQLACKIKKNAKVGGDLEVPSEMFVSKIVDICQTYLGHTDIMRSINKYKPFEQLILGYILRIADLKKEQFLQIEGNVIMLQGLIHATANRHFGAWITGSIGATALAIGTFGIATPIAIGTISKTHKEKKKKDRDGKRLDEVDEQIILTINQQLENLENKGDSVTMEDVKYASGKVGSALWTGTKATLWFSGKVVVNTLKVLPDILEVIGDFSD